MLVWPENSKNIFLRSIVNMESLIRENKIKEPVKENIYTDSIMFRIILILHTNMWNCIVLQTNSQHYHFMVHIQNLMAQGGWVRITIYVLIQN